MPRRLMASDAMSAPTAGAVSQSARTEVVPATPRIGQLVSLCAAGRCAELDGMAGGDSGDNGVVRRASAYLLLGGVTGLASAGVMLALLVSVILCPVLIG